MSDLTNERGNAPEKDAAANPTPEASGAACVPLIDIRSLSVTFTQYAGGLSRRLLNVITDLSISVHAGEMVAIVGSSGSGKSLLAHAIMGILPKNASTGGQMFFKGEELDRARMEALRGDKIAFIPQSVECLDPLMRVGAQVAGPHGSMARAREAFDHYELPNGTEKLYPFQLSGGMARRVLLSTAAVTDAELIIADEPTPGLTHKLAVEALQTFREFANSGKGVLLITHDLDLAYEVADRVVVFYAGVTVEDARAADFREGPDPLRHPYSKALWAALPQNGFTPIGGLQPYAGTVEHGCVYADRCEACTPACKTEDVPLRDLRGGKVRCILAR